MTENTFWTKWNEEGSSSDQEYDVFVRKDTFPVEAWCVAVAPDQKKYALGLDNGSVAIFELR